MEEDHVIPNRKVGRIQKKIVNFSIGTVTIIKPPGMVGKKSGCNSAKLQAVPRYELS